MAPAFLPIIPLRWHVAGQAVRPARILITANCRQGEQGYPTAKRYLNEVAPGGSCRVRIFHSVDFASDCAQLLSQAIQFHLEEMHAMTVHENGANMLVVELQRAGRVVQRDDFCLGQ